MDKIEHIKKLLASNETEAALTELAMLIQNEEQEDTLIMLSARYNSLARQKRLGLIDYSVQTIEHNKIIASLLSLINELSNVDEHIEEEKREKRDKPDEKRLALLIGCSDYEHAGILKNPINDVLLMKKNLEELGFSVIIRENPNLKEIKMTVDDFGLELKNYDVGLFYFAGHGIQVSGLNYLIPVEANLVAERFVEYDCLRVDRVLQHMEECNTKTNIVILDACRNNPFERTWKRGLTSRGLAMMDAPRGSFIAYATAPGKTASDGEGKNGLYTEMLCQDIQKNGLTINQIFQNVRRNVMKKSNEAQIPWEATSLTSDFYFNL